MIKECIRRLNALKVDPKVIQEFKDNGTIPCLDSDESFIPLNDEDRTNIAEIEEKGNKVYLVIHGLFDGVLMHHYLITSSYTEDWSKEFYKSIPRCCVGYGYVKSELTYDTFDTGYLNLYCHDGKVRRVTYDEALELSDQS